MNSVSTLGMSYTTRKMVSVAQYEISKLSGEIGTGVKHDVAASLGTRHGDAISSRNLFDQTTEYKNNISLHNIRMEMMATSYEGVEETGKEFFGKLSTMRGDSQMTDVMKNEALSMISNIIQQLNISNGERFLFSGIDGTSAPLVDPAGVSSATGISPLDAMGQMFGSFPLLDANSAQDLVAYIDLAFKNDPSVAAQHRFEGTFYKGTPSLDASGNQNPRVTARIDQERVLSYGAQANDDGFKELLKGAYIIASMDFQNTPKEVFDVLVNSAFDAVGAGLTKMRSDQAVLAGHQNDATRQVKTHDNALKIMNERIVGFEYVDLIEANAKMTILETQLQASIVLTNRMASLSIASMML